MTRIQITTRLRGFLIGVCLAWVGWAAAGRVEISGRTLELPDDAQVSVQGVSVNPRQLRLQHGMKVRAQMQAVRGAALPVVADLRFDFTLRGPVTALNPLRVLGQALATDGGTELVGLTSVNQLQVGQTVQVSGHPDPNGALLATFIELGDGQAGQWLLSGVVSALGPGPNQIRIGDQAVDHSSFAPVGCAAPLAVGQYMDLRATPVTPFTASSTLSTLVDLRCATPVAIGTPGAIGALEGIVGVVAAPGSFPLGDLTITYDNATLFRFGTAEELIEGVRIEVDGAFTSATVFAAGGIAFIRPMMRVEGPVQPADLQPGARVRIQDQLVRFNAQLRDEDGYAAAGLSTARQLEVRGYVDEAGGLFATRVRDRGQPDPLDQRLRGPVSSVAQPRFTLLGTTVDTSSSLFEDANGTPINAASFFAQLAPGAIAEISGASYQSATRTLSGGIVAVLLPAPAPAPARTVLGIAGGGLLGTVSTDFDGDVLLRNGFE